MDAAWQAKDIESYSSDPAILALAEQFCTSRSVSVSNFTMPEWPLCFNCCFISRLYYCQKNLPVCNDVYVYMSDKCYVTHLKQQKMKRNNVLLLQRVSEM